MPTLTPYNKDGLEIVFSLHKVPDSNCLTVNVTATNHTLSNMTEFLFQVAVPRVSISIFIFFQCFVLPLVFVPRKESMFDHFYIQDDTENLFFKGL